MQEPQSLPTLPSMLTAISISISCVAFIAHANPSAHPGDEVVRWDARAVEHLLNRAGFGATGADIARGLAIGQAALVAELVDGPSASSWVDVEPTLFRWDDFGRSRNCAGRNAEQLRRLAAENGHGDEGDQCDAGDDQAVLDQGRPALRSCA